MGNWRRRLIRGGAGLAAAAVLLVFLDQAFPPDLSRYHRLSVEVLDSRDRPLRLFLSDDGYLRLPVTPDQVDPHYLNMLIAYEDRRFYRHMGVDPLALIRAAGQALAAGRIISGASTLTMQTARLLEPRARTLPAKLIEMFRALQLERRYSKEEILSIYLTLAPFGGNREGVRAASLTYFGRPPRRMTAGEAALLVALPQSPSRIRPDRHPARAKQARDKILRRVRDSGVFAPGVIDLALKEPVIARPRPLPLLAPHLAERLKIRGAASTRATWIDADLQRWTERNIRHYVANLPPGTSAALLVVENKSRQVRTYVGSAAYDDDRRDGYVDMVRAIRSPGSVLKPMIYGMALERGLAHPESRINDAPTAFGDYQPKNFMGQYHGDISLRAALQLSLNVPAVIALERLGPTLFVEGMRRHGLDLILPGPLSRPGLPVALGGVGTRLEGLVKTYAALADDGRLRNLKYLRQQPAAAPGERPALLGPESLWHLADMLRGVHPPAGFPDISPNPGGRSISYKTGTSYGFRDAWALGYNRDYTVGVWIGRPDGAPNPGLFGARAAAPFLFRVFDRLPAAPGAHLEKPPHVRDLRFADLPPALKRLDRPGSRLHWSRHSPPPQITFPVSGAQVILPEDSRGLVLAAEGGKRPFTWIVNGVPLTAGRWAKTVQWQPDGPGFSEIMLIDALGRRATSRIRVRPPS